MRLPSSPRSPKAKGFSKFGHDNDSTVTMVQPNHPQPPPEGHDHHLQHNNTFGAPIAQTRTNMSSRRLEEGQVPVLERESSDEKFGMHVGRRRGKFADKKEEELTKLGKIWYKLYNASIVTRYFIYLVPLSVILAIPTIIGAVMDQKAKERNRIGGVYMQWFFLWFQIVWVSLWVGKLIAKALPYVFQALIGVVSSGVKKYAVVLRALELPISLVLWAVASLVSFQPCMKGATGSWKPRIDMILRACLVSSLIFLGEKFFVQLVSVNYHRKQFEHRIKDNKRNVRLLSHLYEISRKLFPVFTEFKEEDYIIQQGIAAEFIGNGKSGSATPMRQFVGNVTNVGDKLTSALGNVAREVTGKKNVFNPTSAYSIVLEALKKKTSSEALARRIWLSFVPEGSSALTKLDLLEVMGDENEADALDCFHAIDSDDNGDVSLEEMILFVTHLSSERKAVAKSMQDVDNAIGVLDNVLSTVVFIIVVFVFIAFNLNNFSTMLAAAGTVLLSLSFVFAITAQEVLGSCIFLFVKHPFDVGDRVDIDNNRLVVEHISLLYSVFKRVDDSKTVQVPNNVLNTKWIENISRSKYMQERLKIFVNYDTTLEDISLLRGELQQFISENSRDFQRDFDIEIIGVADLDKLELRLEIKHKSNWANEQVTMMRRNKFFCTLVQAMKKVPIYGPGKGDPGLGEAAKPMYTVAIPDEIARENMKNAAEEKKAKRMDYVKPDEDSDSDSDSDDEEGKKKKDKKKKEEEDEKKKNTNPFTSLTLSPTPDIAPLTSPDPLSPLNRFPSTRTDITTTGTSTSISLSHAPSNSSATGRRRPGQGLHSETGLGRVMTHGSIAESMRQGRPSVESSRFASAHEMQRMSPPPNQQQQMQMGAYHPSQFNPGYQQQQQQQQGQQPMGPPPRPGQGR